MTGPTERISQILAEGPAPEPPRPPTPGDPCAITVCDADTRRGTLDGGAPMWCGGFGATGPCIANWLRLSPEDQGEYLDYVEEWLAQHP